VTSFDRAIVSRVAAHLAAVDFRGLCDTTEKAAWVMALYPELDDIIGDGFDNPDAAWREINRLSVTHQHIVSEISLQLTARHFVKQHYQFLEEDGA